QWYQCEKCQLGLKTVSETEHRCPNCGTVYTGEPYDDVIYGRRHRENWNNSTKVAWAYAITGEERFAAYVREMLLGYADRYLKYPYHDNRRQSTHPSGGHMLEQTLSESAEMCNDIAPSYDLVMPALSEEDRERINEGLIRPLLENADQYRRGMNNWQSYHNAAMISGG